MAGDSPAKREARVALARANSWEARYAEFWGLIADLRKA
jgi:hypothetical protein